MFTHWTQPAGELSCQHQHFFFFLEKNTNCVLGIWNFLLSHTGFQSRKSSKHAPFMQRLARCAELLCAQMSATLSSRETVLKCVITASHTSLWQQDFQLYKHLHSDSLCSITNYVLWSRLSFCSLSVLQKDVAAISNVGNGEYNFK